MSNSGRGSKFGQSSNRFNNNRESFGSQNRGFQRNIYSQQRYENPAQLFNERFSNKRNGYGQMNRGFDSDESLGFDKPVINNRRNFEDRKPISRSMDDSDDEQTNRFEKRRSNRNYNNEDF